MTRNANEQTHPYLNQRLTTTQEEEATVRIISPEDFDDNTPQSPGIQRFAAISGTLTNSKSLWAGYSVIQHAIESAVHHHGEQETVVYVKSGLAKVRWGDQLQNEGVAEAGSFTLIPAYLIHQEINPSPDTDAEWIVVRSGPEAIVINVTVPPGQEAKQ